MRDMRKHYSDMKKKAAIANVDIKYVFIFIAISFFFLSALVQEATFNSDLTRKVTLMREMFASNYILYVDFLFRM